MKIKASAVRRWKERTSALGGMQNDLLPTTLLVYVSASPSLGPFQVKVPRVP